MKKTFIFGLMAAALGFSACGSEDDTVLGEETQKSMVLNATVAQPSETRAEIDASATNWKFAFGNGDVISVNNSAHLEYYTFRSDGTKFTSTDAEPASSEVTWYAYFPSESITLTNQNGTLAGLADKFALAGATTVGVKGDEPLEIAMKAQVAIIKIDNQKGSFNIKVKVQDVGFVTGLTAKSEAAGFTVNTENVELANATPFLSNTDKDIYYIAVPAGVPLEIYDGDTSVKTTTGLTAGKYYPLFLGDILPTYVSSTGSDYGGEGPEKLIDAAGTSTKWCSSHAENTPWEIVVKVSQAAKLKTIKLWNANDTQTYPSRIWKTLKVYGSTTGEAGSWSEIKDFTPLTLEINNEALAGTLIVNASAAYEYYKLVITADYDSSNQKYTQQMSDMKFVFE